MQGDRGSKINFMQTRFRIPLLAIVFLLILASCTKTNKQGKVVPENAAFAVHIDGGSLSAKLPWNEVKQNVMFREMYADSSIPVFVKKALDNPDNSGIDTKSDLVFFAQKDTLGGIVALTGTVKDAEKFKLFCIDLTDGGSQTDKDGVSFISRAPMCVGWNKEKFLFIMNEPALGSGNAMYHNGDPAYTPKSRDLLVSCKNLFDLKESNSLGENEKFTTLVKKTGDIHFWVNTEELTKSGFANSNLAMISLNKLFEGSVTAATLNFENGKIVVDAKSYASKELTELYKKYGGKTIDEAMIMRLPSKDVAAVFAMSFKPEGIKELLKILGVEGLANIGLTNMGLGFTMEDFIKANKGDILFAVTDIKEKKDSIKFKGMNGEAKGFAKNSIQPDIIFATSIADKDAFNLLIKAGTKLGGSIKGGDSTMPSFLDKFGYNTNDKYFAIGNSKENIEKYLAGNGNNNFDFLSKINGNPFGGYINFQFILKALESNFSKDSSTKIIYDASLKMWDNIYIKGGNYEDGGTTKSIEINLMDKNTNSLKQLNQYLGLLGKQKMESHKRLKLSDANIEEIKKDPAFKVPPPPSK